VKTHCPDCNEALLPNSRSCPCGWRNTRYDYVSEPSIKSDPETGRKGIEAVREANRSATPKEIDPKYRQMK
jgi:hypothetical protein